MKESPRLGMETDVPWSVSIHNDPSVRTVDTMKRFRPKRGRGTSKNPNQISFIDASPQADASGEHSSATQPPKIVTISGSNPPEDEGWPILKGESLGIYGLIDKSTETSVSIQTARRTIHAGLGERGKRMTRNNPDGSADSPDFRTSLPCDIARIAYRLVARSSDPRQ